MPATADSDKATMILNSKFARLFMFFPLNDAIWQDHATPIGNTMPGSPHKALGVRVSTLRRDPVLWKCEPGPFEFQFLLPAGLSFPVAVRAANVDRALFRQFTENAVNTFRARVFAVDEERNIGLGIGCLAGRKFVWAR